MKYTQNNISTIQKKIKSKYRINIKPYLQKINKSLKINLSNIQFGESNICDKSKNKGKRMTNTVFKICLPLNFSAHEGKMVG